MSFSDDIIYDKSPNLESYLAQGNAIDDIDEYGFTPLIECAIAGNVSFAKILIAKGADVNKTDVTGRTPLHWAVDNSNLPLVKLFLEAKANANAFTRGGQPVLVYPLLRDEWLLKQTLYQHGASLEFAHDFINTKLIGHRYQLKGDVDIVSAGGEFIELDYEGFFLEFSLDVIADSLSRFRNHFAARNLRELFAEICDIIDGFNTACELIRNQHQRVDPFKLENTLREKMHQEVLILPVAYKGHAITFIRCGNFFAKCDRGENSLKEGTVNIYIIDNLDALTAAFLRNLLYHKQTERYVHKEINRLLGLRPILQLPISRQTAGNCSWANVEAVVPIAYVLQCLARQGKTIDIKEVGEKAIELYRQWLVWDKDRALEECIKSFHEADRVRKASKAAILGAILFQACDYGVEEHMVRAEKILNVLKLREYHYVLDSYLTAYCTKRLTVRGNNLLKLLDDAGIDPKIGVSPVATGLANDGELKA